MKLAEAAIRIEALEAKVDNLVAECLKIREENVNLKELVENLRRNTTIQRENMEKSDLKIKELKEKLEEAETKIGNDSETEAKNLQEKVEEVIKVQETVKQIESNLSNSQAQIMEEAKKMTATYADVSKVKETVNEMEKKIEQDIKTTKEEIKTQLAATIKKNEFKSHLGQHARNIANLADVNKDIVILGHEEKVVEDGIERYNEDKKLIVDILKVINPEFAEQNIIAHRRLGLFEKGKKRPLKVTFLNKQIVTDIIKKAKVLATHEEYKKIWIRENMTKDDRVTLQKKLEEVKNKNEQRTEEEKNLFIWRVRGLQAKQIYYRNQNVEADKH